MGRLLQQWEQRGHGLWAVEEKATGEFIDRIGLMHYEDVGAEPEGSRMEVGLLLDRRRWGRGLATEGVVASLPWGFEGLGLVRIISIIRPGNATSRRVVAKAGLKLQEDTR